MGIPSRKSEEAFAHRDGRVEKPPEAPYRPKGPRAGEGAPWSVVLGKTVPVSAREGSFSLPSILLTPAWLRFPRRGRAACAASQSNPEGLLISSVLFTFILEYPFFMSSGIPYHHKGET